MGNSVAIGTAYADQDLTGSTITNATLVSPTMTGATVAGAVAATTLSASGATTLNGNVDIGNAASDTIAFYGATKVGQRAFSGAVHATSAQAVSASFGATQLATLQEVQKTLIGLGIWATA